MKIKDSSFDIKKIDLEKRVIEEKSFNQIKSIFNKLGRDAGNLYKASGRIPYKKLAKTYQEEIKVELQKMYNRAVNTFGFMQRENIEKKYYLNFNIETSKSFLNLDIKKDITINDSSINKKLNDINNRFFVLSKTFIPFTSKKQSELITKTNERELERSVIQELRSFDLEQNKRKRELDRLSASIALNPNKEIEITRQINKIKKEIANSNKNKNDIVGKNISANLIGKSAGRTQRINEYNVGLGESWSRFTENKLINDAAILTNAGKKIKMMKKWVAILDSVTRDIHGDADGQIAEIDQDFIVGGEKLSYPRDQKGSLWNIINCRCVVQYIIKEI